jgi:nucleotide-binding universal stress UspA family protein
MNSMGGMTMYKHFLLPHDGSDLSSAALTQAIRLAKSLGAKLTIMHVVQPFHLHLRTWATPEDLMDKIEKDHDVETLSEARKLLAKLQNEAKMQGLDCEAVAVLGEYPFRSIIDQAGKSGCDVIVMASHGRSGLEGLLLGSETVKVLTHSSIPVLVMR